MIRTFRTGHKWAGFIFSLFILVIAVSGFLLATKAVFPWIRPAEVTAQQVTNTQEIQSIHTALEAAFKVGISELKTVKDVDRVDYRPKSNIFKITSKEGYHEVQVDGKTGQVIQVAKRTDQLAEDVHDLSFFSDALHKYWLPIVAIGLVSLVISGVGTGVIPILRKAKYKRDIAKKTQDKS